MTEGHIDAEAIKALLEAFEASDWDEMTVSIGGDSLQVSRSGKITDPPAASAPGAAPATPPPPSAPSDQAPPTSEAAPAEPAATPAAAPSPDPAAGGTPVESPTVGVFWVAPAPGAPPFVEVGSRVEAGETIGIVEVMKLMNHVPSAVSGTVSAVLVGNGEAVEFGQALVLVETDD